ncbi:hypothetical protein Pedsa_2650 [Pseudopedobacter saltans DSM 12145]|uniref:Uncharacterized protein n=1 Tax=Pseudopedobacter saltans (strain ATCC 51119 / DSM 12145 / JCM 21818 / CCUG 39354 / LMG 10337 / NBRC 100064 / NCIMB 13643) TaxID=762903 RepID=F0S678_PSESL|nr:hypothetical protein [Pseudopedobacter saltans]ADY53192.1 hypothetical protein Pedsa_2650 [Pseudopedobacter saltans DSM 12145]
MRKFVLIALISVIGLSMLQSCSSSKLCPAYSSYPEARARR